MTTRVMTPEDLPFALDLCRLAGWNQLAADWQRLLGLDSGGVFLAEDDGRPCGTVATISYGATAWIGLLLVHPDFRRHGIATILMNRAIEHLHSRGCEAIKLDATDEGRLLYLKLGFRDERPVYRYSIDLCATAGLAPPCRTANYSAEETPGCPGDRCLPACSGTAPCLSDFSDLDLQAFGADRTVLLRSLRRDGFFVAIPGQRGGYGFARPGAEAVQLGPIVAASPTIARRLVADLLGQLPPGRVYWNLLPGNAPARQLAESLGFSVTRRLTRMCLGDKMNSGDAGLVYAAAGFELG